MMLLCTRFEIRKHPAAIHETPQGKWLLEVQRLLSTNTVLLRSMSLNSGVEGNMCAHMLDAVNFSAGGTLEQLHQFWELLFDDFHM